MGDRFKIMHLHPVKPVEEPESFKEKENIHYLLGNLLSGWGKHEKIFKKKFRKKKDRTVLKAAFKLCLKQPNKNLCENACTL